VSSCSCITCSDEGRPALIHELDAATGLALTEDDEGRCEETDVTLVGPVEIGDKVLVHAGVALVRL
jgi:hydrogenase maturation factor